MVDYDSKKTVRKWLLLLMFKLRYNLLALIQILIGFFNYFLLIKVFGVSSMTDSYLITSAILSSLLLIQMLTTEQFLFFYNDAKAKSTEDAYRFYNLIFSLSVLTGIITFILFYSSSDIIINFFIVSLEEERLGLIKSFFMIASIELIFAPIQQINQKFLNAEMKFSIPYILNIIPALFVSLSMIYVYYSNTEEISLLIYARLLGGLFILPLSFIVIKKMNVPIVFNVKHEQLITFIKKSFMMRLGHNIHNFLFTPITTNILAMLPVGYASYFFYALRISTIVSGLTTGPSFKVLQSKFSNEWSKGNIKISKLLILKYLKGTIPLLIASSAIGYYILPYALHTVNDKLSSESLIVIQSLYLGLMIWQFIILIESGYVTMLIAENKSNAFILSNILFAIIYFLLANILFKQFTIYSLIYSLIIGQILNYIIYTYLGKKVLKNKER